MRKNIVYKITNKVNQRYYFGSTNRIRKRMLCHFLRHTDALNQHNELHEDIKILGEENFQVEILFETEDLVEASRLESKLIRKHSIDMKMYNKTMGASGRRVFYKSDIVFIRQLYNTRTMTIEQAYKTYFKNIVTFRAFKKVWFGDTFKDIHSEVFTKENKEWYFAKGQSRQGEVNGRSILTADDVRNIRKRKQEGEPCKDVYKNYQHLGISESGFYSIWGNRTWKHIKQ